MQCSARLLSDSEKVANFLLSIEIKMNPHRSLHNSPCVSPTTTSHLTSMLKLAGDIGAVPLNAGPIRLVAI